MEDHSYRVLRSTLIGSSGYDEITRVEIDEEGDLVLLGYSEDPGFLDPSKGRDREFYTGRDPFIMKVSRDLTHVMWSTILRGSFNDVPMDMALGPDGDVYIVGTTNSPDLTVTKGVYQRWHGGGVLDAFVCRLSGSNGSIVYSTYLGGNNYDYGTGLTVDDAGRAIVVGTTRSLDFPRTYHGTYSDPNRDLMWTFAVRLSERGRLEYSSWLGADCYTGFDLLGRYALVRVELDDEGCPIVAGTTHSNNLTTGPVSFQQDNAGRGDLFVCKLTQDAKQLVFATYLGGGDAEYLRGLDLDKDGNIVLSGWTRSTDFPTTFDSYRQSLNGSSDGFVLKLTPDGGWLVWSSLLGIGDDYYNRDVEVGPEGDVYVVGTNLTWRQGQAGYPYGWHLPVIVKLDPDCTKREYVITFNDSWTTQANGISIDRTGTVVIVGSTRSESFPTTPGTIKAKVPAYYDGFIVLMSEDLSKPFADAGGDYSLAGPGPVQLDGTASRDDHWIANWRWMVDLGDGPLNLSGPTPWVTYDHPGVYPVVLIVTDGGGNEDKDEAWVFVSDPVPPVAVASTDPIVDSGTNVTLDGSGSHDNIGVGECLWRFSYGDRSVQLRGRSVHFVFDLPGVYSILLTVWDLDNNSASDIITLEVLDTNAPWADAGDPLVVNQYVTVILDGSRSHDDIGIALAQWRFFEGGAYHAIDGLVVTRRFVNAGVHDIALHVWDAAGNHDTDMTSVIVNDTTPPRVRAGSDVIVGVGELVFFDGSATFDNTAVYLWEWSFSYERGTMFFDGPGPHSFRFARPGVHFIVLKATDPFGNVGTDYFRVEVVDITPPSADAGHDIYVFVGEGVDLVGSDSQDDIGICEYRWYIGQGEHSLMLRGVMQDLVMERAGEYYVLLVVRDDAGNTDWDWMRVVVSQREEVETTSSARPFLVLVILLVICIAISFGLAYRRLDAR